MTSLSASDVAARRIREERTRRKWRVRDLADRCKKAGAEKITAAVITNLETRRRRGREITAEELLALAWVLEVPPAQLLCPLDDGEALQVVPGEAKGPVDAAEWLADEDAAWAVRIAGSTRAQDTERVLRYRGQPLTVIRQIRAVALAIDYHDHAITLRQGEISADMAARHEDAIAVLGVRLLHLLASMEALGHSGPPLDETRETLARYGVPATLAGQEPAGEPEGEPDGQGA